MPSGSSSKRKDVHMEEPIIVRRGSGHISFKENERLAMASNNQNFSNEFMRTMRFKLKEDLMYAVKMYCIERHCNLT